jgi:hypothetical protein
MDWLELTQIIEHHLGMYVGRATYERAIALLRGFDLAQGTSLWPELQKRVEARHQTGSRGWPQVLLAEALGADVRDAPDLGPLSREQNKAAIACLCRELRSCLDPDARHGGIPEA